VPVPLLVPLAEGWLGVPVAVALEEALCEAERVGDSDPLAVTVLRAVVDCDADADADKVVLPDAVCDADVETDELPLPETVALVDGVVEADGSAERLSEPELVMGGVILGEGVHEGDTDVLVVIDDVAEVVGELDTVTVTEGLTLPVTVSEKVLAAVGVKEADLQGAGTSTAAPSGTVAAAFPELPLPAVHRSW